MSDGERGQCNLRTWVRLGVALAVLLGGCTHSHTSHRPVAGTHQWVEGAPEGEPQEGTFACGNSFAARIQVLIARGEFAEARMLIAEATASGMLSKPHATRLLHRITQLNTKLGEIPARLQRAKNFPSQLKDYTLHQIEKMLDDGDFSLASQAQLKEAAKLIKEQTRLMEKL